MTRWIGIAMLSLNIAIAHGQWTWEQLPDFPGTARDDAAAFSIGCHTYVGTGMQVGWSLTNDWWRFDNWALQWQPAPALPATPRQYCTAQSIGSTGYLFGGLDGTGPLNELWSFDGLAAQWTQRASLPGAGRYACSSFTIADTLYVCCGIVAGGAALNELWAYDPLSDQWFQRASIPGVGRHRASSINEEGLILGGADAAYAPLVEAWDFEPATNSWSPFPPLAEGRFGGAGAFWYGVNLIAGAVDNSTFRADTYRYDLFTQSWQPAEAMLPSTRRGGVVTQASCATGWSHLRYGLGLDGTMARRNDWFGDDIAFTVAEHGQPRIALAPNPVSNRLRISISQPGPWALSIVDARGSMVQEQSSPVDGVLDVSALRPGPYLVVAVKDDARSCARFIKLP